MSVPSGKHTKNDGKSLFFMGKLTIKWPCSIAMLNYQRVTPQNGPFYTDRSNLVTDFQTKNRLQGGHPKSWRMFVVFQIP